MSTRTTISQSTYEMYAALAKSLEERREELEKWLQARDRGANATVLKDIPEAMQYLKQKEAYGDLVNELRGVGEELVEHGMPLGVWVKYVPGSEGEEVKGEKKPWKIKLVRDERGDVKLHVKQM